MSLRAIRVSLSILNCSTGNINNGMKM
ncbi:hypothetical protein F383_31865 [Gossypium arboreum]|uniref:Uncharacterized protein n=1 Tax=Gossypium arboreum TaxID=29729 RepID=A0A0B0N056_GOSAR|nr:hypothetical protein F383_31865 [Gossypium arboreum]